MLQKKKEKNDNFMLNPPFVNFEARGESIPPPHVPVLAAPISQIPPFAT